MHKQTREKGQNSFSLKNQDSTFFTGLKLRNSETANREL